MLLPPPLWLLLQQRANTLTEPASQPHMTAGDAARCGKASAPCASSAERGQQRVSPRGRGEGARQAKGKPTAFPPAAVICALAGGKHLPASRQIDERVGDTADSAPLLRTSLPTGCSCCRWRRGCCCHCAHTTAAHTQHPTTRSNGIVPTVIIHSPRPSVCLCVTQSGWPELVRAWPSLPVCRAWCARLHESKTTTTAHVRSSHSV